MNEHTSAMLEFAAIVTPLFIACFGGIIAIFTKLAKLETLIKAERDLVNEKFKSRDDAIKLLASGVRLSGEPAR
jgi:hypothetical protein